MAAAWTHCGGRNGIGSGSVKQIKEIRGNEERTN